MLIGNRKYEKMLKDILGGCYEFKVIVQKLPLLDLLDEVSSVNDCFPLLSKLFSIVAVLVKSPASCERGFSVTYTVKNIFWSSLQASSMNDPSLEDFHATRCVEHWHFYTRVFRYIKSTSNQ
jgi:hypothetical protein